MSHTKYYGKKSWERKTCSLRCWKLTPKTLAKGMHIFFKFEKVVQWFEHSWVIKFRHIRMINIKCDIYSSHFSSFFHFPFLLCALYDFCSSSPSSVTSCLKPNLVLPVPMQFTLKKMGDWFQVHSNFHLASQEFIHMTAFHN